MVDKYSWIKYIKKRIRDNKNFLEVTTGPTGSGKSWTNLAIAEMLDPEFKIERVVFKAGDLMRLINSNTLKKGSVILWDEAQIDLNARSWQSLINKVINFLITTFRHQNFILLFTSPYADFMDSATMKLFHANFETVSINKTDKTVTIKPKLLQYNQNLKKWYRKYLKVSRKEKGMTKIKRWKVKMPSEKLIKDYEQAKKLYTSILNREIENKLNKKDKKEQEEQEPEVYLNPASFEAIVWGEVQKGWNTQQEVADRLNEKNVWRKKIFHQEVSHCFKKLRKKGKDAEKFKIFTN